MGCQENMENMKENANIFGMGRDEKGRQKNRKQKKGNKETEKGMKGNKRKTDKKNCTGKYGLGTA